VKLPFTTQEFLNVFFRYNQAVWPWHILLYLLGIAAVILALKGKWSFNFVLSFLWLWTGVVYQIIYFSKINWAAYLFGVLFIIQGLLFASLALKKVTVSGQSELPRKPFGYIFIAYALIIYPILGWAFGHGFPHGPIFGVPCPTTIFTFGILLLAYKRIHWAYLIIPLLWTLIGASAAFSLGIPEDYGLDVAGVLGSVLLMGRRTQIHIPETQSKIPEGPEG
jgi:hypothetical protein